MSDQSESTILEDFLEAERLRWKARACTCVLTGLSSHEIDELLNHLFGWRDCDEPSSIFCGWSDDEEGA